MIFLPLFDIIIVVAEAQCYIRADNGTAYEVTICQYNHHTRAYHW
jgi:hypothetical protein